MENMIWKGECKKPGRGNGGIYYVFQCLYCQKPFISPGYEVNAGRMTKYCSNNCQKVSKKRIENSIKGMNKIDRSGNNNSNYKDGRSLYTKYRKNSCEICGAKYGRLRKGKRQSLFVHHCDGDRTNSDPSNLRTVCMACHMNIHNPSNYGKYPEFQKW